MYLDVCKNIDVQSGTDNFEIYPSSEAISNLAQVESNLLKVLESLLVIELSGLKHFFLLIFSCPAN
jgi:hypothetical protein